MRVVVLSFWKAWLRPGVDGVEFLEPEGVFRSVLRLASLDPLAPPQTLRDPPSPLSSSPPWRSVASAPSLYMGLLLLLLPPKP
jgi:hypothetical protein